MKHILGIVGSHRKKGNAMLLVEACLNSAKEEGAVVRITGAYKKKLSPCWACEKCYIENDEFCVQRDGMDGYIRHFYGPMP